LTKAQLALKIHTTKLVVW